MKHAALAMILLACSKAPTPTTPQPEKQPDAEPQVAVKAEVVVCANLEACRDMFVETGTVPPLRQLERTVTGELGLKVTALITLVEKKDPDLGTSVEVLVDASGDKALRLLPIDATTKQVHDEFEKAAVARERLVRMTAISVIVPVGPSVLDAALGAYVGQRLKAAEAVDAMCMANATADACSADAYASLSGHELTIGLGSGSGTAPGFGPGGSDGRPQGPTMSVGQPNASGDLDKAIIRRYIKRNIQKIQYCYEKELTKKPKLEGTVNAQFTITPQGNVQKATASGVDAEVSACVAKVIKTIEFPKPKGGGSVQVNFPFTFRFGGG